VHARVARAFCWPAGSLAWASYRAGPLGLAQEIRAELDPAQKIKKKTEKNMGGVSGPAGRIPFILFSFILIYGQTNHFFILENFKKIMDPFEFICRSLVFFFRVFHCIFDL